MLTNGNSQPPLDVAAESPSFLAGDLRIDGTVFGGRDVRIRGAVEGRIDAESVVVEEGAWFRGEIVADSVRIGGFVEGPVTANQVILDSTAHVVGSIFHNKLTTHAGAVHEGRKPWRLHPLAERLTG